MAAPRHSCVCYTHYTNSMAAISESVSVLWMPTGQQAARLVPAVLASCDRLQQTPLALLLHCTVYAGSASTINVFWASPNATSLTSQHVRPICDCNGCPEPCICTTTALSPSCRPLCCCSQGFLEKTDPAMLPEASSIFKTLDKRMDGEVRFKVSPVC